MPHVLSLTDIQPDDLQRVGGKAIGLVRLADLGFLVPKTLCLTVSAYNAFLDSDGLRERIMLVLNRKAFEDMRWEEIWDAALRIRSLFLTTPIPSALVAHITEGIGNTFEDRPTVVRSSAPGEDAAQTSFAGLHATYVNVTGIDDVLTHIRKVWSSLWSDAALLYRQELGLSIEKSSMAVVIQELVPGGSSGVFFSQNPLDQTQSVLEAVYGLNQGLVDGSVPPDRWLLDRATGRILTHTPAVREQKMVPAEDGVRLCPSSASESKQPPLDETKIRVVQTAAATIETSFGAPQDIEWTYQQEQLVLLQARPITTGAIGTGDDDKRSWYLSLHRSFENLLQMRQRIEGLLIPEMIQTANELADQDISRIPSAELIREIHRRQEINDHWVQIYWKEFIPFAHGTRLFGQVYNDAVRPDDPYEFMRLLERTELKSMQRNRMLAELAALVRHDTNLSDRLRSGSSPLPGSVFQMLLEKFIDAFGDLSCSVTGAVECGQGPSGIIRIILEMAAHPRGTIEKETPADIERLTAHYLSRFKGRKRKEAQELLSLGRISYQLRDDDNIYLGRIEAQLARAVQEAKRRIELSTSLISPADRAAMASLVSAYSSDPQIVDTVKGGLPDAPDRPVRGRQLVGQPASPGIAAGKARVIRTHAGLMDFAHAEVLVVDAVDPNMTFVVPLAAAVVERRGGMLIHGAIIAREYGIPCVTGVPEAVSHITTGDHIVVDGFLGIVTLTET